jgi:hypothetical protein
MIGFSWTDVVTPLYVRHKTLVTQQLRSRLNLTTTSRLSNPDNCMSPKPRAKTHFESTHNVIILVHGLTTIEERDRG